MSAISGDGLVAHFFLILRCITLYKCATVLGFPGASANKESACNLGDLGSEDFLEKGMATHSGSLSWKIPWIEEPGRLQSMGLQRIGHNSFTLFTEGHLRCFKVWQL